MSNVVKSFTNHTQFLSQRAQNLKESATIAMSRRSNELREQGIKIINLSLGEPDFPTPSHICEAAIRGHQKSKILLLSSCTRVYQDVCQVIAEKFAKENRIAGNAENIVISTGAKQSIANVLLSIIDPGDEVLLPAPYWVSYPQLVHLAGGSSCTCRDIIS